MLYLKFVPAADALLQHVCLCLQVEGNIRDFLLAEELT